MHLTWNLVVMVHHSPDNTQTKQQLLLQLEIQNKEKLLQAHAAVLFCVSAVSMLTQVQLL